MRRRLSLDFEERVSVAVFAVATCSVLLSVILPFVSLPQTVTYEGPAVSYGSANYTISGYYIPTVSRGALINITLCCFQAGDVYLSLFPSKESEIAPSSTSILTMDPTTNVSSFASVRTPATQPYGIYVISYNGTAYALTISSTWSPFFVIRGYTEWLFLFMLASGVAAYYYRETATRRKDEKRVWAELTTRP